MFRKQEFHMNHAYLTTECINERNKALTKAGEGIVAARKSLDQLEEILSGTVTGNVPDIGQVADTTHRLREEIRSEERRVGKECRSRWSPYH